MSGMSVYAASMEGVVGFSNAPLEFRLEGRALIASCTLFGDESPFPPREATLAVALLSAFRGGSTKEDAFEALGRELGASRELLHGVFERLLGLGMVEEVSALFEAPLIVVAAPRSGSTFLFELLALSPELWTIGGESHVVIESVPELRISHHGYESDALGASDATSAVRSQLFTKFARRLRDHRGVRYLRHRAAPERRQPRVRFLEKTPRNAFRIPFLAALFPDARFVFLHRDPKENVSSLMNEWLTSRWPGRRLPDWPNGEWQGLVPPGWRQLIGRPVAEIAAFQWAESNRAILDALAPLPKERWCAVSYAELVADRGKALERVAAFAGLAPEPFAAADAVGNSKSTLTAPRADKWLAHADAIRAVLPSLEPVIERIAHCDS